MTADHLIHTKLGTGFPLDALLDASLPFLPALHPVAEVLELVGNWTRNLPLSHQCWLSSNNMFCKIGCYLSWTLCEHHIHLKLWGYCTFTFCITAKLKCLLFPLTPAITSTACGSHDVLTVIFSRENKSKILCVQETWHTGAVSGKLLCLLSLVMTLLSLSIETLLYWNLRGKCKNGCYTVHPVILDKALSSNTD